MFETHSLFSSLLAGAYKPLLTPRVISHPYVSGCNSNIKKMGGKKKKMGKGKYKQRDSGAAILLGWRIGVL